MGPWAGRSILTGVGATSLRVHCERNTTGYATVGSLLGQEGVALTLWMIVRWGASGRSIYNANWAVLVFVYDFLVTPACKKRRTESKFLTQITQRRIKATDYTEKDKYNALRAILH
jgi:hypothetical protein